MSPSGDWGFGGEREAWGREWGSSGGLAKHQKQGKGLGLGQGGQGKGQDEG